MRVIKTENSLPSARAGLPATDLKKKKNNQQNKNNFQFSELTGSSNWGYSEAPQSKPTPHSPVTYPHSSSMKCAWVNGTWQPVPQAAHVTSHSSDGLSLLCSHPGSPCLLFSPSTAPCPALRPSEPDSCPGLTAPCSGHLWFV